MSAVLKPGTASTVSGDADVKTDETIDGFQLVIDALKLNGIDTIFGLPGIPITDLTRKLPARRPARDLVPARAERRLRRVDRRLPDAEAGHLPHGVRARLPQRPDGARATRRPTAFR